VDEPHLVSCRGQPTAKQAAHPAGADDRDPHA
jgi:hypothetical protein